mmetsp:Transcript_13615/g.28436  ORF Transcript_13615/g.28436 Transcript_13615/m.28436 type:complete len:214 (+) Transcript_13615:142-783(+)
MPSKAHAISLCAWLSWSAAAPLPSSATQSIGPAGRFSHHTATACELPVECGGDICNSVATTTLVAVAERDGPPPAEVGVVVQGAGGGGGGGGGGEGDDGTARSPVDGSGDDARGGDAGGGRAGVGGAGVSGAADGGGPTGGGGGGGGPVDGSHGDCRGGDGTVGGGGGILTSSRKSGPGSGRPCRSKCPRASSVTQPSLSSIWRSLGTTGMRT